MISRSVTQIENTLEKLGIPLWASDEPINLNGKRSSQVLTRRVKQGVAEWYVLEMLEKSWGGFEIHTEQGFKAGGLRTVTWPRRSLIRSPPAANRARPSTS
ncbi:hypothetical protein [Actinomadura mexicana]|uniref:hypothetical protein n=1 Tax=Actinomadura mexicana TaxID=134959 RepID=UPI0015C5E416|nr:hypothetical protein [Actinomadura mexicana]